MEWRTKVDISSTWDGNIELLNVLYIKKKSGIILDEPERSKSLILLKPTPQIDENCGPLKPTHLSSGNIEPTPQSNSGPCYIHIKQLTMLSGYTVCGVELVSGSRIMEVYSGDDYIATCKGSPHHDMYQSCLELPSDSHYNQISLKLLCLHEKTSVRVVRLALTVTEDHGASLPNVSQKKSLVDLQELVNSISPNAPPFLSTLLTSLQQCQGQRGQPPTNHHSDSPHLQESNTLDLSQMLSTFRQIRPMPITSPTLDIPQAVEDKDVGSSLECVLDAEVNRTSPKLTLSLIEELIDRKVKESEIRMQSYIDGKLASIMNQIETKMTEHLNRNVKTPNGDNYCPQEHKETQNGMSD